MTVGIRYIFRHIGRGGGKTVLPILLALLLAASVGRLDTLRDRYEVLSQSVVVQGSVLGGLSVKRAEHLAEAEEVVSYYLEEIRQDCEYLSAKEVRPNAEHFVLCFTSDYTKTAGEEVYWLEGWTQETFQNALNRVCLMPTAMAEEARIELGDRIQIAVSDYADTLAMNNPEKTPDEIIDIYRQKITPTIVVGFVPENNMSNRLWLPIHGMDSYASTFAGLKVETAIYTLRDYRDVYPFRERFLLETSREKGNPSLYLDTAEADRIRKMAGLLNTLYPIALGVALLLGGLLPGLMVLQSSRETAILRVLGMSRRKVCFMLMGEQALLCVLGLILGITVAFLGGGKWELVYPLFHLFACLIGSIAFAWFCTNRELLSLLQAKE